MNIIHSKSWMSYVIVLLISPSADVQMAMPMYPFVPPFGMPMPMPMPMPAMHMPPIVQIAVPALPPPTTTSLPKEKTNIPVCPPCTCFPCIPAFFSYCSPCHLKCRCRDRESVPEPLPKDPPKPLPVPFPAAIIGGMPPPVMVIPVPPLPMVPPYEKEYCNRRNRKHCESSSTEEETFERMSRSRFADEWDKKKNSRRYSRRYGIEKMYDDDLVRPVLSYITDNGDVKFKTKISNLEAAKLLGDREPLESLSREKKLPDKLLPTNVRFFGKKGKATKVVVTV